MKIETKPYDPALFIKTHEDMVNYLNDAYMDDDPKVFLIALGDVAKIKGISELAQKTGLNTESLYKTLSGETQASWSSVQRIMKSLNINLNAAA